MSKAVMIVLYTTGALWCPRDRAQNDVAEESIVA
jgi:hypothetical protein